MKGMVAVVMAMATVAAALPFAHPLDDVRIPSASAHALTGSRVARGTTNKPRESFADVVEDLTPSISLHKCVIYMAAERASLAGASHWMGLAGVTQDTSPLTNGMKW